MLDVHAIKPQDLKTLSAAELAGVAAQMLAHIGEQSRQIGEQSKRIDSQAHAIKWRDAKIESITFQLARRPGQPGGPAGRFAGCRHKPPPSR
jgi:transposase